MPGGVALDDQVRILELAPRLLRRVLETDREGAQVRDTGLGEQGDQQAGVQPPGEQHADRDVRHLAADLHGMPQGRVDQLQPLLIGARGAWTPGREPPIRLLRQSPVRLHQHPMPGGELTHAAQDGPGRRHHRMQGEEVVQGDGVETALDSTGGEQRLDIRGEAQQTPLLRPIQGFDAEAITREEELAPVRVPEREGEHPVQPLHAAGAPGVPCLEDDLGVAVGEEVVAAPLQLAAQRRIVVDGAIEDQRQPQLSVHHGLIGAHREVDDGEAAVTEGQGAVAVAPAVVWAAAHQLGHHGLDRFEAGWRPIETQLTADTAHRTGLPEKSAPARVSPALLAPSRRRPGSQGSDGHQAQGSGSPCPAPRPH